MLSPTSKSKFAAIGGVAAAAGSALCCAGPLVAVALGLSGAGLASTFEPLRPYFVVAAVFALGLGFWAVHRQDAAACEPGARCASPQARHRMKIWLWTATIVAIPLLTFPWWSSYITY